MTNLGHILGSLLALYYLSGRWSFARLEGTYLGVSMLQQPRLWIAITFIGLATITYSETRQRCASIKPNFLDLTIISWLLYMIAAAAWSPDPQLAAEKAIELSLLLAIAVGIMLARSPLVMPQMNTAFWTALVVICVAMGGLALFMSTGGRVFVPTGGPNTFGRNMGLAGVGAIYLAARSGATVRAASVGVVAMALMSVVMCGSRGGLLAAIVATGILVVSARMRWHTKAAVLGIFAVVGAAAFTFTSAGKNALLVFQHLILHQTV